MRSAFQTTLPFLCILAVASVSVAHGQTSVPAHFIQRVLYARCTSPQPIAPGFRLWVMPPERLPGLNVSLDCLQRLTERIWPQPGLLEVSGPKGCQLRGSINEKGTP